MEITLVIVSGLVLITIATIVGDYLTKTRLAQTSVDPEVLRGLQERVAQLEAHKAEQETKLARLENDVAFTTRLLESKKSD